MRKPYLAAEAAQLLVFDTALGWVAARTSDEVLTGLTFGHDNPGAAVASLGPAAELDREPSLVALEWIDRIRAFAGGRLETFTGLSIDLGERTPFQRRVLHACRDIAYGQTVSYGALAERVGAPRAARAVGTVMRINPLPLVIPCHRVIASHGKLGGYSAWTGTRMKQRLLQMERRTVAAQTGATVLV